MPIGQKMCGCCRRSGQCGDAVFPLLNLSVRDDVSDVGDESVEWGVYGDGYGSPFFTRDEHARGRFHPLRLGSIEMPGAYDVLVAGDPIDSPGTARFHNLVFPPDTFRHMQGRPEITFSLAGYMDAGGGPVPPGETFWDLFPRGFLLEDAGAVTDRDMALPLTHWRLVLDGVAHSSPQAVAGQGLSYDPNNEFGAADIGGVSQSISLALSEIRGKEIAVDLWFELQEISAALIAAQQDIQRNGQTVSLDHIRRFVRILTVNTDPATTISGSPLVGQAHAGTATVSGLTYCPTLNRDRHTWKLEASNIPAGATYDINFDGGVSASHTFENAGDCFASEARDYMPTGPFGPQLTAERWSVRYAHIWPEVQHTKLIRTGNSYSWSTMFYRPSDADGWNGVSPTVFHQHSAGAVTEQQVGLSGSPTVTYLDEFHRNPPYPYLSDIHPDSFELTRLLK